MKKKLLFIGFILSFTNIFAQYTITDENDNPVPDNSTINYEIQDAFSETEIILVLHSETSDNIVFQVTGSTQPEGAENSFCVGQTCYAPNDYSPKTETLDSNNEALIILHYNAHGITEPAVINYKIYQLGNENVNISFSVSYTFTTEIKKIDNNLLFAYPNPAKNILNIKCSVNFKNEYIIFYNIYGQIIKKILINERNNLIKLNISELPTGIYFYSLFSGSEKIITKQIIVN